MEQSLRSVIKELVQYGIDRNMVEKEDRIYTENRILEVMHADGTEQIEEPVKTVESVKLKEEKSETALMIHLLNQLTDYAAEHGMLTENTVLYRDLFDTKIMGCLTPMPSRVSAIFWKNYQESPKKATDYYYQLAKDSNYIRTNRVAKDIKWTVDSPYGEIDMTINLSKPEKDPKAIAAARFDQKVKYPACQLCRENEGYAGRLDHPARQNLRIIPMTICGHDWGLQYSPYVYYNEHCIVLNGEHVPMRICRETFEKLFGFVEQFPHYFLGSNADLPIVGGSILTHDHYQGGHYTFAMERADLEKTFTIPGYKDVQAGIVHWPLAVIRLNGADKQRVIDLADHILKQWRTYSDPEAEIYAETENQPHNTITPIARMREGNYELDLALRNNCVTEQYPLGLFHPHPEYHNIKKENIGLIEVMGLAILPARLKKEFEQIVPYLIHGNVDGVAADPQITHHSQWVNSWVGNYNLSGKSEDQVMEVIKKEAGNTFVKVLENAGVFKCDRKGREAFDRFIHKLS